MYRTFSPRLIRPCLLVVAGVLLVLSLFGFYAKSWLQMGEDSCPWLGIFNQGELLNRFQDPTHFVPPCFLSSAILFVIGMFLWVAGSRGQVKRLPHVLRFRDFPSLNFQELRKPVTWAALLLGGGAAAYILRGHFLKAEVMTVVPWLVMIVSLLLWCHWKDVAATGKRHLCSSLEFWSFAGTVAHLVILGFLYRNPETRWLVNGIVLFVILLLWRRWPSRSNLWMLQILFLFSLHYYIHDIESWRYAVVGDEYDFFWKTWSISEPGVESFYLDSMGIYGDHPISASLHQLWVQHLYGLYVYGWRLSGVLSVHLGALFLYIFLREMVKPRHALVGCACILASHRLLGMTMVGYTIMQGVAALLLFWAVLALAIRRGSHLGYVLAGMASVAGFFTFTLALPLSATGGLMFLAAGWPRDSSVEPEAPFYKRYTLTPVCLLLIGAAVVILPRLLEMDWMENQLVRAGFTGPESVAPLKRILWNLFYTTISPGYGRMSTHYASGPLLDPLSTFMVMGGLGWILAGGWRERYGAWLPLAIPVMILVIGGACLYSYPSNTRIFMLVPACAVLAALFVHDVESRFSSWQPTIGTGFGLTVFLIMSLYTVNWLQNHVVMDRTYPYSSEHYLLKTVIEADRKRPVVIVAWDESLKDQNLEQIFFSYGYEKEYWFLSYADPAGSLKLLAKRFPTAYVCLSPRVPDFELWRVAARTSSPSWREEIFQDSEGTLKLMRFSLSP